MNIKINDKYQIETDPLNVKLVELGMNKKTGESLTKLLDIIQT